MDEIAVEDLIADEDVAISITHTGYIKRTFITSYRAQKRGGRGRVGMKTRDEDFVSDLFIASTHSYILIFSDRGRIYWLKVHEVPDVGPQGKGKAIVNLVSLQAGEKIAAFCAVKGFADGPRAARHPEGDRQEDRARRVLQPAAERDHRPLRGGGRHPHRRGGHLRQGPSCSSARAGGMAIHFSEEDVRPIGRTAYGVKGIELEDEDEVVALEVVADGGTVLTVTEQRLRQAHRPRRVPPAEPRREGHHQHQDLGAKRAGGGGEVPARATST